MKGKLFRKLLITASTILTVMAITLGGGTTMATYAKNAAPKLVSYDVNGNGKVETGEMAYQLVSADDLYWFAGLVNGTLEGVNQNRSANAFLASNITVNSNVLGENGKANTSGSFKEWTPIGDSYESSYCGIFDGANHTISGLYYNHSYRNNDYVRRIGLFGVIGDSKVGAATVKNVGLIDSYFHAYLYIGGICASNDGTIVNCYNKGVVNGVSFSIGGICGFNDGTIKNCYNSGKIESTSETGGICGTNGSGTIENCYNTGEIIINSKYGDDSVGGICGSSSYNIVIRNCYNTGRVIATGISARVGGICGQSGIIENCYNTGEIIADNKAGGICGRVGGKITNCYYLEADDLPGARICSKDDEAIVKTAEQFARGEVCWLLNGGENQSASPVFFQNLDTNSEKTPVLDSKHGKVYRSRNCVVYSNTNKGNKVHSLTSTKQVAATCTQDGCRAYWYCKDCLKYFSDADCQNEIEDFDAWKSGIGKFAALGHSKSSTSEVNATCTGDGCKAYWYCSNCNKYYADEACTDNIEDLEVWKLKDGKIEKRNHIGGTATCTKKAVCETCGEEYGPTPEHKYANTWSFNGASHWHECSVCHDKKDFSAHTLVTVTTKAGIGAEGKLETKCSDCNSVIKTDLIPAITTVKLSHTAYTYNKKAQKPSVIVTDSEGTVIDRSNYTVKYPSGRKKIGKYIVTVTFKGNYRGNANLSFTINPPKTSIGKVKAGKKSFTVNWSKKVSEVTGYQIEYSTSGKFTGKTKIVTVKSAKTASKTISKLAGNKKYYIRIRTYKTVSGKKYYSEWSAKKSVKVKR